MAKARKKDNGDVVLTLTAQEAKFIMNIVQNPITEVESERDIDIRYAIFYALKVPVPGHHVLKPLEEDIPF